MNKKNTKSLSSIIITIFYAITFFIAGLFYEKYTSIIIFHNELLKFCSYLLIVFWSYYFQIIIHELGHLVFGLLTGYKFVSFRIGSFLLIKNEKLSLKKFTLAGTLGQCLMAPPPLKNKTIPYILYNLGGIFFNLIVSIISFIFYLFVNNSLIKIIFLFLILFGIADFVTNLIPVKDMVSNDGYNVLSLYKNPKSIYYFWIQLKVNELLSKNVSLLDMDDIWFEMPNEEDLKDSIIVFAGILNCNRLIYKGDFKQTKDNIEYLLNIETGILDIHRYLLICDLIYCKLILGELDIKELLSKEQIKFMKMMHNYISVVRVEYAIACLYDKDIKKSNVLKKKFEKISLTYPYENELLMEKKLMELVDNKIKSIE